MIKGERQNNAAYVIAGVVAVALAAEMCGGAYMVPNILRRIPSRSNIIWRGSVDAGPVSTRAILTHQEGMGVYACLGQNCVDADAQGLSLATKQNLQVLDEMLYDQE